MAEILSQQQIDELLGNVLSGDIDLDVINEQSGKQKSRNMILDPPKNLQENKLNCSAVFMKIL